CLQSSNWPHSF
nr:immunoglobulin light chain junction region [Macaca mulatta]